MQTNLDQEIDFKEPILWTTDIVDLRCLRFLISWRMCKSWEIAPERNDIYPWGWHFPVFFFFFS